MPPNNLDEYEQALVPYFGDISMDIAMSVTLVEAKRKSGITIREFLPIMESIFGLKGPSPINDAIKSIHGKS